MKTRTNLEMSPLFGMTRLIEQAQSALTLRAVESMPAEEVKQLVLDLLAKGRLTGLSEPIGVEERIASGLRESLAALQAQ